MQDQNLRYVKDDLINYLCKILTPLIYEGIISVYSAAKDQAPPKEVLLIFQKLLSVIPKWNNEQIITECKRIEISAKQTELEKLIKVIIKLSIELYHLPKDYTVNDIYTTVKLETFIHRTYIESSRNFYRLPFLFSLDDSSISIREKQVSIFNIIEKSINCAIHTFIPYNIIISHYLNHFDNNDTHKTNTIDTKEMNQYISDIHNATQELQPIIEPPKIVEPIKDEFKPYDVINNPVTHSEQKKDGSNHDTPKLEHPQTSDKKEENSIDKALKKDKENNNNINKNDTETDYRVLYKNGKANIDAAYSNEKLSSNIFLKREGNSVAKLYKIE